MNNFKTYQISLIVLIIHLDFNFLDENKKYMATIYRDSAEAHWDKNPVDYRLENIPVTKKIKY